MLRTLRRGDTTMRKSKPGGLHPFQAAGAGPARVRLNVQGPCSGGTRAILDRMPYGEIGLAPVPALRREDKRWEPTTT